MLPWPACSELPPAGLVFELQTPIFEFMYFLCRWLMQLAAVHVCPKHGAGCASADVCF